jgi:ComF family protein
MIKDFLLEFLFPKFCLGCRREGTYLCQDCFSLIDILPQTFKGRQGLSRLYSACDYNNFLVKKIVRKLKYKPFARDLAEILISIIILYFQNLEKQPRFLASKKGFLIIPIPLFRKKLKQRGFNQAELIAKGLSEHLEIPISSDALKKTRRTRPQAELDQKQRQENVSGVFACQKQELIAGRKILLIDDVFTTGATMQEAARTLKAAGAKNICGITAARD